MMDEMKDDANLNDASMASQEMQRKVSTLEAKLKRVWTLTSPNFKLAFLDLSYQELENGMNFDLSELKKNTKFDPQNWKRYKR